LSSSSRGRVNAKRARSSPGRTPKGKSVKTSSAANVEVVDDENENEENTLVCSQPDPSSQASTQPLKNDR